MHEWHTSKSTNPMKLINEFIGFSFDTDYSGAQVVSGVKVTDRMFTSEDEAINYVTNNSYGGETAYLAAYTTKKLSKAYRAAFANFVEKDKQYVSFRNALTIAYGRTSSKATCPECQSSINLRYGNRFKSCPVCGSKKIISDSNWKALETKHRLSIKAAEALSKEAEKNGVTFVCGIEWHC